MTSYDDRTALLVVDVQNDFADPKGSLYVVGGEAVAAVVNAEIAGAREAGALVVYSQDWHPESTPHFQTDGGVWPVHCVGGTWGAEFHPRLDVPTDAIFLQKGTGGEDGYSVFTVRDPETGERAPTALERILREHGVERVVVVGLATDYCVKDTALDALRLGFPARVVVAAIRAVNLEEGDGDRAVDAMRDAGAELV
ncbi:MAG: isochorismatase family protein [Actinomycetota bacterium]